MASQRAAIAIGAVAGIVVIDLPVLIVWAIAGFPPASELPGVVAGTSVLGALSGALLATLLMRYLLRTPIDHRSKLLLVSGIVGAVVFAALILILRPPADLGHIALLGVGGVAANLLTFGVLSRVWPQGV